MSISTELHDLFLRSTGVCTDTRKLKEGNLFFALKGPNFNGNEFAIEAIKRGALAAVVDDIDLGDENGVFLVPEVLQSLQALAVFHRSQFDIPHICITGSNGKTTTKELIAEVLSQELTVLATEGNFNNLIGLPLTLLRLTDEHDVAVLELGSNAPGEIGKLAEIAQPTHGLVTNVGKAHLEGFEDLSGVVTEKGALYRNLEKNGGIAFVNLDEPFLEEMAAGVPSKVFYFQSEFEDPAPNKHCLSLHSHVPFIRFSFFFDHKEYEGSSPLFGKHNFKNICAAVAVGKEFGLTSQSILRGVSNYVPSNNRSQFVHLHSNRIILDAYNSNPTSAAKAIQLLADWPHESGKMLILGDMLEIGRGSEKEHMKIVDLIEEYSFDKVFLVGEIFSKLEQSTFPTFLHVDDLKSTLDFQELENWLILLKGSRGIRLEKLLM